MELSLLVQVDMEAYRYESTSFEMPFWVLLVSALSVHCWCDVT